MRYKIAAGKRGTKWASGGGGEKTQVWKDVQGQVTSEDIQSKEDGSQTQKREGKG
jgi:hypothetical protein